MADSWDAYLQPGEHILWEGAPKSGVRGWPKIIGLAVFGMPFLLVGLGVFGAGIDQAFRAEGWTGLGLGLFLLVFSLMFVGVGATMVFGQWYAAARAHRDIRYAVSTRCAYVAKSGWVRSLESYPILKSTALGLEKGRSADSVWFHVRSEKDSDGDLSTTRISFDHIADGDSVYRLLRGIQTGQT
jgi:hypothetical protein